jgi:cytosine/adenosine deaminase-related metal-dependent hydrolase
MPNDEPVRAVQARYVFPGDRPPLAHGIVTLQGGRIVAVGENASGRPPLDLGQVALLPGLVNAHTHLEFSLLDRPLGAPGTPFPQWIAQVVAQRRELADREPDPAGYRAAAIDRGLRESRECGVVVLGEIATPGWPAVSFGRDFRGTVFLELLGLAAERVEPLLEMARQHIAQAASYAAGLSPHAPYTVHPELLRQACELSAEAKIPLAMHLAESIEELELLQSHSGGMVEMLQTLGAWNPSALARGLRPLDYLRTLATAHRALVIHGNFLLQDEIEFVAARRERMTVVYCPRTHAYFPHGRYPLAEMLSAGVRVALGTDSRASNPDLSLLAEMRHIAAHHAVPLDRVILMGTLAGAEALGLSHQIGTIGPGKSAQLCVVPLPEENGDPHELLLRAPQPGPPRPLLLE